MLHLSASTAINCCLSCYTITYHSLLHCEVLISCMSLGKRIYTLSVILIPSSIYFLRFKVFSKSSAYPLDLGAIQILKVAICRGGYSKISTYRIRLHKTVPLTLGYSGYFLPTYSINNIFKCHLIYSLIISCICLYINRFILLRPLKL